MKKKRDINNLSSLLYLVTGGCKSGKSAYAQLLAEHLSHTQMYIATAEARDTSMAARIEEHRASRGSSWKTFELTPGDFSRLYKEYMSYTALRDTIKVCKSSTKACEKNSNIQEFFLHDNVTKSDIFPSDLGTGVILFDCLTLFLAGEMEYGLNKVNMSLYIDLLLTQLCSFSVPVIIVTNEVGLGGIAAHALARDFCDIAGLANQYIARLAHSVSFVVSGIPMTIKGKPLLSTEPNVIL